MQDFFYILKKKIYKYSEEKRVDIVVKLVGGGSVINGAHPK